MLRILQGIDTKTLVACFGRIRADERSTTTAQRAIELLEELFGTRRGEGSIMAARATQPLMDEAEIRLTCEFLAGDLLKKLKL